MHTGHSQNLFFSKHDFTSYSLGLVKGWELTKVLSKYGDVKNSGLVIPLKKWLLCRFIIFFSNFCNGPAWYHQKKKKKMGGKNQIFGELFVWPRLPICSPPLIFKYLFSLLVFSFHFLSTNPHTPLPPGTLHTTIYFIFAARITRKLYRKR